MNSFGRVFRLSIFGESHGPAVGVVIDGCPPGIQVSVEDFLPDLDRRRSGAEGTTPRREPDLPVLVSGVHLGFTTGAPLTVQVANTDIRSQDYDLASTPRPGHADFSGNAKWAGFNDPRGGGHFSGRLTLCLVLAGVVAKKLLPGVTFRARLTQAGGSADVEAAVRAAMADGDSVGGLVECTVDGLPPGLGEPFFDSLESLLAHMLFAIPAVKGVDFGSGFAAATMRGSAHNDVFVATNGHTATNHAGGINGGISNGNPVEFRVAVKATSSIGRPQQTLDFETGKPVTLAVRGRHDACIALRVPVVVEAAAALVLADLSLLRLTQMPQSSGRSFFGHGTGT